MNFDKMTNKSREAIQNARAIALENSASAIGEEHLLLALLSDKDGLCRELILGAGGEYDAMLGDAYKLVSSMPKVSGACFSR